MSPEGRVLSLTCPSRTSASSIKRSVASTASNGRCAAEADVQLRGRHGRSRPGPDVRSCARNSYKEPSARLTIRGESDPGLEKAGGFYQVAPGVRPLRCFFDDIGEQKVTTHATLPKRIEHHFR